MILEILNITLYKNTLHCLTAPSEHYLSDYPQEQRPREHDDLPLFHDFFSAFVH